MHQTRGSLRNPRNRRRWAPAACVLAIALGCPATSLGASANSSSSHRTPSTVLLAWGSGFGATHGSPLVRVVQRHLAAAGYAPGPIDGRFGSSTSRAVVEFQAAHGLQVDGIVGPETWAALNRSGQALGPGAGSGPAGSPTVRALQRRLALSGYSPGPIDGHYGPLTAQAVRRFQATHGLPATGIAGAQTLSRVAEPAGPIRTSGRRAAPHPSPAPVPLPGNATGRPGHNPVPARVERPGHGSSASATALLAILIVLGLGLILIAFRYARRRTGQRASPSPSPTGFTNGAGALGHDTATAYALAEHRREPTATSHGQATTVSNGQATTVSNGQATAASNGDTTAASNGDTTAASNGDTTAASNGDTTAASNGDATAAPNGDATVASTSEATGAFNLGVLLEERGDVAGAEVAYRRADEHGHGAAASNLGVLLEERGASAQAEAAYRRADQRGDATAAFNLGVLLEERGELAGAEAAFRRADQRGNGEVAHLAQAALLDLLEAVPQPSPRWAGGSR